MRRYSSARLAAAVAALAATLVVAARAPATSADIQVFSSGAPSEVARGLAPAFRQASGHGVVVAVGTVTEVQQKLRAGEHADAVILPAPVVEALTSAGTLRPGSRVDLARVGIGVAVRKGAPLPDISSVDAIRKMLLQAKSIAYPDPQGGGFTGAHLARMMERLGIADAVKPKTRLGFAIAGGMDAVAKGEVEVGLFNISEILPVEGATLVGPLPPELQSYITFAGAVHAKSAAPDVAQAFLQSLRDPKWRETWAKGGLETIGNGR
jgi:molybdate transport system substrate-binding protein